MRAPTTATILRGGLGSTNAQRELLNPKQRAARELTYSSRGAECVRDLATLWDIWTDKDQISAGLLRDSPVLSRALPWSTIATAVQSTGFRLTRRQQNQTVTIRPCLRDSRLTQPVGPYKANVGGSIPSAPTKILGRIPRTHSKFVRKFCGSDPEHAVVPPPRARSWRLRRLRPARHVTG